MIRVPVNPDLLRWARERADRTQAELIHKFAKLPQWESGELQPTLKQLDDFAAAVYVPLGYLFLDSPPEESVPIPDLRTVGGRGVACPSPDLLDTIYACQMRQDWYHDFAQSEHQPPLEFVGSATIDTPPEETARAMREVLGFKVSDRRECRTWEEALRHFVRQAEDAGVLVMVSGVAKGNNRRPLDPDEFRGFALADRLAPLVFVNGRDTKAARMFTLAHELAHLWLGASALSGIGMHSQSRHSPREEVWCNAVAAEVLVPLDALRPELRDTESPADAMTRLASVYRVSRLVILRRLLDADWVDREIFDAEWAKEIERLQRLARVSTDGGNFYRTTVTRVSRRFASALVMSTLEGQTLYRDALRMLGIKKIAVFDALGEELGLAI